MGIKEKFFILFIIVVIIFPFFFNVKEIKVDKKIKLPNMVVQNGDFKYYKINLQRVGDFTVLSYFNQNNYIVKDLKVKFLDKNSTLFSKKMIFNKVYNLYNMKYKTDDYIYLADYAKHYIKGDKTIAYNFRFFNKKIDGKGTKMVYKNDKVYANNIIYIIKGLK